MILLVDHYDSYTNNLAHLFGQFTDVRVVRCDSINLKQLKALAPQAIILSPGPGRPDHPRDVGISADIVRSCPETPILGVCLGHQIIAHVLGGKVNEASHPLHGRTSAISHTGELLKSLPQRFQAMRYHSLSVSHLPSELLATAHSDDGELMAFEHRSRPWFGVQFHPESIATEHGERMAKAFCELARVNARTTKPQGYQPTPTTGFIASARLQHEAVDPAVAFECLFATAPAAYLLHDNTEQKAFSFLGAGIATRTRPQHAPAARDAIAQTLPFCGGVVGYLEYEGAVSLIEANDVLVCDHQSQTLIACAFAEDEVSANKRARALADDWSAALSCPVVRHPVSITSKGRYRFDQTRYEALVSECIALIRKGEAYELCLTNRFDGETTCPPWPLYLRLMQRSATSYSAFLKIDERCVLSSSPERLLRVREGVAETRPIKGTRPRGINTREDEAIKHELQTSDKDRAENLMIVDVSRHDLGAISEDVSVPRLLEIETYPSVFQLVSTVRATTQAGPWSIIDAVSPAASMTGAPKRRAIEWLRALEGAARGVYSGALGYIDRSGNVDLAVVIRTIVMDGSRFSFGVGGAVLLDSDPRAEWDETQVKAAALLSALGIDKLD